MTPKIVLIGLPTCGKTRTAEILSQQMGLSWVDTDAVVEKRYGKPIPWIFQELGEAGFRALEYQVVAEAIAGAARIISLGGGAVTFPATAELLQGHAVYYLRTSPEYLIQLQGKHAEKQGSQKRPLLQGDFEERIKNLFQERKTIYENLTTTIVDAQRPYQDIAQEIIHAEQRNEEVILVGGAKPYKVVLGTDLAAQVVSMVSSGTHRVLLLSAPPVMPLAEKLALSLGDKAGVITRIKVLPDGESAKQLSVLKSVWDAAADFGLERGDLIIPVGGGATTDLGGFAAATWLRGIKVLQVPTTLLAMVDAAIGGKTGIDWSTGKNLVGSFYPPVGVAIDFHALATLPKTRIIEGLGEALKCGFISDSQILEIFRQEGKSLVNADNPQLHEVIRRSVQVKAEVVSQDLCESGIREYLNFGHTLAHAIELAQDYKFAHGNAVAIGMVFASYLGVLLGVTPREVPELLKERLETVGLPADYQAHSFSQLYPLMLADKKVRGGVLRFVLLRGIGKPVVQAVTDIEVLQEAARMTGIPKK